MPTRLSLLWGLVVPVIPDSASQHEMQIQVLSTLDQNVRGVVGHRAGHRPAHPAGRRRSPIHNVPSQ